MVSLTHPSFLESVTSQLDLFSVLPTQTSLEDGFFTEYRPISVLTSGGPVEFCIAAESSNYIDLANIFLYVRASVTKADGTALAANTEIAPECNFLIVVANATHVQIHRLLRRELRKSRWGDISPTYWDEITRVCHVAFVFDRMKI